MSDDQVRELLRKSVDAAGGQRAWAKAHKFSAAYVNDVLLKRRLPAEKICNAIGVTRLVVYQINYVKMR